MADSPTPITVQTEVSAPRERVWTYYTDADHIVHWNAASPDWHTPHAQTDLRAGGAFNYRMEARDGSHGFDLEGRFSEVRAPEHVAYTFDDGRTVTVDFAEAGDGGTSVTQTFVPDAEGTAEQQRAGWQAILDSFRSYAEGQADA